MSEIPRSQATGPVSWPHQHGGGSRRSPYEQYSHAAGERHGEDDSSAMMPTDAVSRLGRGFEDLPAAARDLVHALIAEHDTLRQSLLQAEGRVAFLEALSDEHAYMPILNRRALLREISVFTHQPQPFSDETESIGAVVLFYLMNFEKLHRSVGLIEAEEALIHLARQLAGAVRASDRVGSVGGAGVMVMMAGASSAMAHEKASALQQVLGMRALTLRGVFVPLDVQVAVFPLRAGDEGEEVLASVDALLREVPRPKDWE